MWLFENNRHMMYPTLGLNIIQLKCGDYKWNFSITEKKLAVNFFSIYDPSAIIILIDI